VLLPQVLDLRPLLSRPRNIPGVPGALSRKAILFDLSNRMSGLACIFAFLGQDLKVCGQCAAIWNGCWQPYIAGLLHMVTL
jgi:hypothetical protein